MIEYLTLDALLAVAATKFVLEPLVLWMRDRHFRPHVREVLLSIDLRPGHFASNFRDYVLEEMKECGAKTETWSEKQKDRAIAGIERIYSPQTGLRRMFVESIKGD